MRRLLHAIDTLVRSLGRAVAWASVCMALLTFVVVILRYGFDTGAIALQELVMYLHGVMFMLGLSYTLQLDGHVRVDIFYVKLSPIRKRYVNLAGHLLFLLPVCAFIFWYSLDYVAASWRILEGSAEVAGIPAIYILKTTLPVASLLLFLQGCAEIVRGVTQPRSSRG